MSINAWLGALGAAAVLVIGGGSAVQADSLTDVENARAKDRAGYHTTRQDREKLRRYGRNDDHSGYGDYGYHDGPHYGGGGVSVYVGPSRYHNTYDY